MMAQPGKDYGIFKPLKQGRALKTNACFHLDMILSFMYFICVLNQVSFIIYSENVRSQSNRAPLGCGGMGDSHHGCAADKSTATV